MKTIYLNVKCLSFLRAICCDIADRPVGSEGNRKATKIFRDELRFLGWDVETPDFKALDWNDKGAKLNINGSSYEAFVSPYSPGCHVKAPLAAASSISDLENNNLEGKIVLLNGDLVKEQLMPKNFMFYNPDHHKQIVSLLENSGAKALVCATGKNGSLAGGVSPFPLIEDGDFLIPSVYLTEEEGRKLQEQFNNEASLEIKSERLISNAYNVIGRKGNMSSEKIVITAHIDSKKGSPGAVDNATGAVTLLLLADLLKDYQGSKQIEIVAFNGEDYYSVPGQMNYITANRNTFDKVALNINIDGVGYKEGSTAFSFYNMDNGVRPKTGKIIKDFQNMVEGEQWMQGDHGIFVKFGRPAIAVTSKYFIENIESQDITHTPKDNIDIVDCRKLVELADVLHKLILKL